MADLPFDEQRQQPQPQMQPFQQQPPQAPQDIAGQWNSFLSQPGASQFMLQAGINLMQPPRFGDNPASQIGRAIGAGAEAVTTGELVEGKLGEQEAKSRAALERSAYAGERTGLLGLVERQKHERAQSAQETQIYKSYVADLDRAEQRYNDKMKIYMKEKGEWDLAPAKTRGPEPQRPPALPPRPSFREWLKARAPELHDRMYPASSTPKPTEKPEETETE